MKKYIVALLSGFSLLFLAACCATIPNFEKGKAPIVTRDTTITIQDDSTCIFLCISGGGSRALTFGYYVTQILNSVKYKTYDTLGQHITNSLLDEVDVASGVSGGSFACAAIPIYKNHWDLFEKRAIKNNIELKLILKILLPWNWGITRSEVAANYYDKAIFEKKRFGELQRHPILKINSTLLAKGVHFVFDSTTFSYINSDINSVRIADAVNSSSCFPGGFNPRTFINYTQEVPDSILQRDKKYAAAILNSNDDIDSYLYAGYRRYLNEARLSMYLHVSDGGIAGNTGIEAVINEMKTGGILNKAINSGKLKRFIVIVVNAGTEKQSKIGIKKLAPNSLKVVLATTSIGIDAISAQRVKIVKDKMALLWQSVLEGREAAVEADKNLKNLEQPYFIEISSRKLSGSLKDQFDNLPTNLYLNDKQIGIVKQVVDSLMRSDSDFNRLKMSLIQQHQKK